MADYSYLSVFWMYGLMFFFVFGTAFFLRKAIRNGSVSMDEAPKYRMLEDDGPAPAPRDERER